MTDDKRGYLEANRRKLIIGGGSLLLGGTAAIGAHSLRDTGDISNEDGQLCYKTESDRHLGEDITVILGDSGSNGDYAITTALQDSGEAYNEACFDEDEIRNKLGEDYQVEEVKAGEETLLEP